MSSNRHDDNNLVLPLSGHQVSFNKRTHASTLYKYQAAKQRLEELERQNSQDNQDNGPSKRMRLSVAGDFV